MKFIFEKYYKGDHKNIYENMNSFSNQLCIIFCPNNSLIISYVNSTQYDSQ